MRLPHSKLSLPQKLMALVISYLALFSQALAFDTLTATVDKNPVMADESITLTVTANASLPRDAFDTSVLEQDFKVIRTSVSSHTEIINLTRTVSTTWQTLLFPRREGKVTIPALNVNNILSSPIELEVLAPGNNASQEMRDIFMTTEITPEAGYVMQQFTYTIKLYLGVELERGSLQVPALDNVVMEQIGEDEEANIIQTGKRYRVITRRYSIIPQESGPLTISSPIFEGNVRTRNRGSFGGLFNPSKPVNQLGPELNINIKPIPTGYMDKWLPSEFVQINDEWSSDPNNFVVGEPITRTITLTALGVDQSILPELSLKLPPSVKAYPDQAQITSIKKGEDILAQRVENVAIIPNRDGTFVLPEVRVPWFNTLTERTEYAVLPARSIQVQPNAALTPAPAPIINNIPNAAPMTQESLGPVAWHDNVRIWQATTVILLLSTILSMVISRNKVSRDPVQAQPESVNEKQSYKNLLKSIESSATGTFDDVLCQWLSCWFTEQATLVQYAQIVKDPAFADWINRYYQARYKNEDDTALRNELTKWLSHTRQSLIAQHNPRLPDLYPSV